MQEMKIMTSKTTKYYCLLHQCYLKKTKAKCLKNNKNPKTKQKEKCKHLIILNDDK